MKTPASKKATTKVREVEPFSSARLDLSKFKPDLSAEQLRELLKDLGNLIIFPPLFFPIETLSPTKTVGHGRTNLTIVASTLVQTDAVTPAASFDHQATPTRNPTIQMHFEPSAYGITSVATYLMQFRVQVFGQSTFNLSGFAGAGTVLNGGTKVLNGPATVSLVLKNVPPSQQTFGFLEQTGSGTWSWFTAQVSFPPIVITI